MPTSHHRSSGLGGGGWSGQAVSSHQHHHHVGGGGGGLGSHSGAGTGASAPYGTVAPAAGSPALGFFPVVAPRRAGGVGGAGLANDTVNDFLAERRRGRPDGQADGGPRFNAYARYLGIDPVSEQDLLWVARCALHAPLPEGWTQHYDGFGRVFFYDSRSSRSSWTHPLEQEHREVHGHLRKARLSGTTEAAAEEAVRLQLATLEPQAAAAASDWTEHSDENGLVFFYSRSAQRSSWMDPRPSAKHRAILWRAALDVLEGRVPQDTLAALMPCFREEAPSADLPPWLASLLREGSTNSAVDTGAEGPSSKPDAWLSPRLLLAERAVECPVCYEPLYCAQPSVLQRLDTGRRLCGHYFCLRCAQRLGGSCPLCRARAPCGCVAKALPNVERGPRAWFHMVDSSCNGRLERDEVVRALEAVLPLDAERLRRALGVGGTTLDGIVVPPPGEGEAEGAEKSGWWNQWQADSEGGKAEGITEDAFCAEGGLLQWIVENLRELRRAEGRGRPPDLRADNLQTWFEFWASEPSDGLSRAELLRALMRTLGVSGVERQKVREIRGTIEHCYHVWAPEGNERVTREAFIKSPGGLGEQLIGALLPSTPQEEHPSSAPASPPAPPPAFSLEMVPEECQEKPALLRSCSFQDLVLRLSRLRSCTEEPTLSIVSEDITIDTQRV